MHIIKFKQGGEISIYAKKGVSKLRGKTNKLYGLGKRTIWAYKKKETTNSKGHKREVS